VPVVAVVIVVEVEPGGEIDVVELTWNVVVDKAVEEVFFMVHAVTSRVIIRTIARVKILLILLFPMYYSNEATTKYFTDQTFLLSVFEH
jgi:hypothetical protein